MECFSKLTFGRYFIAGDCIRKDNGSGDQYYYVYDALGDVKEIRNVVGVLVVDYDYDIYGEEKSTGTTSPKNFYNPIRYSGQYFDEESGLYYLRARYYSPEIMRFISEDTFKGSLANPLTLNYYAYCSGDPIAFYDPSGNKRKGVRAAKELIGFNGITKFQGDNSTQIARKLRHLSRSTNLTAKKFNAPAGTRVGKFSKPSFIKKIFNWSGNSSSITTKGQQVDFGNSASSLNDGLGSYSKQGGHHPMAKKAFEGAKGYDARSALTINKSKLDEFGVKHASITGQQHSLYNLFYKTGKMLTMKMIEIKSMTKVGIPIDYATNAVEKAIKELLRNGVTQPLRIPWGK